MLHGVCRQRRPEVGEQHRLVNQLEQQALDLGHSGACRGGNDLRGQVPVRHRATGGGQGGHHWTGGPPDARCIDAAKPPAAPVVEVHPTRAAEGGGVGHQPQTPTHLGRDSTSATRLSSQPISGSCDSDQGQRDQVGPHRPQWARPTPANRPKAWPGGHSNCVAADLIRQIRVQRSRFPRRVPSRPRGTGCRPPEPAAAHRDARCRYPPASR